MRISLKIATQLIVAACISTAHAGAYEDFFRALAADNLTEVNQLLARGFDPNARDERGQPALTITLRDGSQKVGQALLAHPQLQVDALNPSGETPLMIAALRGIVPAMRALIERGATVQREGWSPIHYAATGPSADAVALLLDKGAAIDARSPNGSTPLMMAARYGSEAAVALLVKRGADATLRNDRQLRAADFARQAGREKLADELERLARR